MNRIRKPTSLVVALLATVFGWVAVSPSPLVARAQTFGESVEVQRINVEVWVTDRKGNAITGLGVEDFEIFEDGKLVEISNFAEISNVPLPSFEAPEPIEAPVDRPRGATLELEDLLEDSKDAAQPGFFVLYMDDLFTGSSDRKQLVEDLKTLLDLRRIPAERILILRQEEGLRVEANLGSNRAELEAALARLEKASAAGIRTLSEKKTALRRIQEEWERVAVLGGTAPGQDPCDSFASRAFQEVQTHVVSRQARIRVTLENLSAAAGFLAGLPGPKTLLYISDGLTTSPGEDLLSFVKFLCPGQNVDRRLDYQEGLSDAFRDLSRHANANRVTMYTLQASGLRQQASLTGADQKGVRRTVQALNRFDSQARIQDRQGLIFLAEETGGRSIFNRNRFIEELEQIAEDMTSYYSLAYAPTHDGDGLEHRIEVRVKDRPPEDPAAVDNMRVRHRPGYRDKGLDQRMLERLESALYLNLMANPLEVSLGAGEIRARGDKLNYSVPLHVRVPVENITFLPQQGGDIASLRVQVMSRDERHRKSAFKQEVYRLERPEGDGAGQKVSLVIELELNAGIHVVAFGVRDEATQEASFVATGIELQQPPTDAGAGQ